MRSYLQTYLLPIGIPSLLLAIAYMIAPRIAEAPILVRATLPALPYVVLVSALLLSTTFNRSRAFFVVLLVMAFYWLIGSGRSIAGWLPDSSYPLLLIALAIMLPLNIALLAELRERGITTLHGLLRLTLITLEFLLLFWLLKHHTPLLVRVFSLQPMGPLAIGNGFNQMALIAITFSSLMLLSRFLIVKTMFEISLLAVIFALTATVTSGGGPVTAAIYTTTAGALLLVAIIFDSHHMAYRDDLTGLPARRALQEALLKLGPKYTIAMLDIDHFKKFNDTHGHDVGDQVLKLVASRIRGVRSGGKPFRYGGEEFTILFPRKRCDDVLHELERLRESVAASQFQLRAKDRPKRKPKQAKGRQRQSRQERRGVTVTISIGMADRAGKGKPEQVLKRADQALYRAKKGGRNRVSA